MRAEDIMTAPVLTVSPGTELAEVVAMLLEYRIGGVPVIDDGQLLGVVDEGDLVRRCEIGTEVRPEGRSWWRRWVRPDPAPLEYVHSHGRYARDVMNGHVICAAADASLAELADMFEDRRIRRVPVLRGGKLVGVVTRADLVRALARGVTVARPVRHGTARMDDASIRSRLLAELSAQPWWAKGWSEVDVEHGIVRYLGVFRGEAERRAAQVAAENVPGVRGIDDRRMPYDQWQPML
ncbi:MAG: CBS domain-containing protein [Burkholderiaceae bacterium]